MHKEIEKLIHNANDRGELTDNDKEIILKKADELGVDIDEVSFILEAAANNIAKPYNGNSSSFLKANENKRRGPNKWLFIIPALLIISAIICLLFSPKKQNTFFDDEASIFNSMDQDDDTFSFSGKIGGYDYVDLGLSVKWATKNIGAKTITDSGNFFAWGESKSKRDYSLDTYFDYAGSDSFNKYQSENLISTLASSDDAACILWGKSWRMPTYEEIEELISNCSFIFCTIDDVSGMQVKSNINSKSIFIPESGYIEDSIKEDDMDGFIWVSSIDTSWPYYDHAFALKIGFLGEELISPSRHVGIPVRPVTK